MTANKKSTIGQKVMTPEFRVSFANVFEPIQNQQGKMIYELTMLIPKTSDIKNIGNSVNTLVREVYPKGAPPSLRSPYRDGDQPNGQGNIYEGYPGNWYIRAWSKNAPGIINRDRQEVIDPREFYPGCYARATITPFIYNNTGNQGISFFLNNIQKLRDGEPLSGGSGNPLDDFEDDLPAASSEDPNSYTAGPAPFQQPTQPSPSPHSPNINPGSPPQYPHDESFMQ